MEWHYAEGGRQVGPVSEAQLNQLVSAGTITPDTLVWREGMPDWKPYRTTQTASVNAAPAQPVVPPPPGAAPPVMAGPTASCVECGHVLPTGEMISYGETWVCARCKPVFFQRIREGAPLAANLTVVGKNSFTDAEVVEVAKRQKAIIWLILISIPAYVVALMIPFAPFLLAIVSLVFIYRLSAAVKDSAPWLYLILGLIPCVSLIALLFVNSRATAILKARNVRVGLMGARKSDLEQMLAGTRS